MEVEQLPDLSDWRYVEVWTLEEAAMLWAAIDPIEHRGRRIANLERYVNRTQYKKALLYLRAAKEAVCAGTLPFTDAWEEHIDERGSICHEKIEFPKLPEPMRISADMTRIKQAAFIKWAQGKKIPSYRQTLTQARKIQEQVNPPLNVVDVVEDVRLKESEPVLLLAGASALDTNHPLHAEEVGFAAQAWEIAIRTEAPLPGKTVKQTIRHILDTYPQFSHLSNDAKTRISQSANYDRKGGVPRTPQKIEPTHSQ